MREITDRRLVLSLCLNHRANYGPLERNDCEGVLKEKTLATSIVAPPGEPDGVLYDQIESRCYVDSVPRNRGHSSPRSWADRGNPYSRPHRLLAGREKTRCRFPCTAGKGFSVHIAKPGVKRLEDRGTVANGIVGVILAALKLRESPGQLVNDSPTLET